MTLEETMYALAESWRQKAEQVREHKEVTASLKALALGLDMAADHLEWKVAGFEADREFAAHPTAEVTP